MTSISDLLNLSQVRSVLTVSPSDLPDSVLESYGLEDDIEAILDSRLENWREFEDVKHLRSLRLFTKFKAASIVAVTAQLFVLKKNTDGSNEGQRSDKDGFLWLSKSLSDRADAVMGELLEDLELSGEGVSFDLVGKSVPTRDPITEPREDVS